MLFEQTEFIPKYDIAVKTVKNYMCRGGDIPPRHCCIKKTTGNAGGSKKL